MTRETKEKPKIGRETITEDAIPEHIALAKSWYETPQTIDFKHLCWKFCLPPSGSAIATTLRKEGALIGRSIFLPKRFYIEAYHPVNSGTICDLLVDPNHRSARYMIPLLRSGSNQNNTTFIIHGSNEYSDLLYRKLFKYPRIFDLDARGLPLRVPAALSKLAGWGPDWTDWLAIPWRGSIRIIAKALRGLAKLRVRKAPISDDELTVILDSFRKIAGPHFERTPAFANWRFSDGPLFNAELLRVEIGDQLVGFVAVKQIEIDGMKLQAIIDFATNRILNRCESYALAWSLASRSAKTRADAIAFLGNMKNPLISRFATAPFMPVPAKLLPHENPIYIVAQSGDLPYLDELGYTFMTLADIDFF